MLCFTINLTSFSEFVEKSAAGVLYHFEDDCKKQKERMDEFL